MILYSGCSRCLIHVDARSTIRARWVDPDDSEQLIHFEIADDLSPQYLADWYTRLMDKSGGHCEFEINQWIAAFKPITTWNGDPICVVHLMEVRERERRVYR